ncbi:MAG: alpha/beta hydrolase [Gammaproteobacteria bacterium]|nr:alpha/beta hydrolase [Gammaproteobacteria bacterium]
MKNETVVLVHGLWMNGMDMSLMARRISRQGYQAIHFRYNSLTRSPRENAMLLHDQVKQIETPVIHFICHSLGGLVVRHLFFLYPGQHPGRVVTLGTPHKPSYSAYRISRLPFGKILLGKSIADGLLGNVPKWKGSHDLGSIAGNLRLGLGMFIPGVPRPNDGTVTVEETCCDKMKDHVVLKVSHFGMLLSPTVSDLSLGFIQNGKFALFQ